MNRNARIFAYACLCFLAAPKVAAAPINGTCDVFFVIGQSNIMARGQTAGAPTFPNNQVMGYSNGSLSSLSGTGGPMPAFGQAWYNATGRMVVVVNAAVGASSLLGVADSGHGHWNPSDTGIGPPLLGDALSQMHAAVSYVTTNNICRPYTNGRGYASMTGTLYALGERDSNAYNMQTSGITYDAEVAALQQVIGTVRNNTDVSIGFYISRVGHDPTVSDAGYALVRSAQEGVANPNDANTMIVFWDAVNFSNFSMQDSAITAEYTQAGYNLMGTQMANTIRVFFSSLGL